MSFIFYFIFLFLLNTCFCKVDSFRFASHYADHMVLQRQPKRAVIWGFGEDGSSVSLQVDGHMYSTQVNTDTRGLDVWKIILDPYQAGGPYVITATSIAGNEMKTITLADVYFGDVWLCGGQSNMQFNVDQSFTQEEETTMASNYPHIRLFTVNRYFTNETVPELEPKNILLQWTVASKGNIGSKPLKSFSAICWMFGRRLFDKYSIPIGLINVDYGGTCVEAWSSPETLTKCNTSSLGTYESTASDLSNSPFNGDINDQNTNSVLWNAMIHPLLNTTIHGVIWYQGERNSLYRPEFYNCTFPAMIEGWRKEWFEGTSGQTSSIFPFGFVQLAALGTDDPRPYFPLVRWKQTAEYGYVPNERQRNVFMAVAYDLPDDTSPFWTIHPRDKETVAERLFLGAQNLAYYENTYWTGPIFQAATLYTDEIRVSFTSAGYSGIQVRSTKGFEVQLSGSSTWTPLEISGSIKDTVVITYANASKVTNIRYNWKSEPCLYKRCAIYSNQNQLPAPPFVSRIAQRFQQLV